MGQGCKRGEPFSFRRSSFSRRCPLGIQVELWVRSSQGRCLELPAAQMDAGLLTGACEALPHAFLMAKTTYSFYVCITGIWYFCSIKILGGAIMKKG